MRLNNDWDKVLEFEEKIAEFCGSKYAVAIDSNTNGIKLALEYLKIKDTIITIPKNTYVSVPNQIIHSGNIPKFEDIQWSGEYILEPTPIVDSACRFKKDMYINDTYQVLSFHHRKILNIGKGGMILTNDENFVKWARPMIYDGRHIDTMYNEDVLECIGYHMYMTPEDAQFGIELFKLLSKYKHEDCGSSQTYKDLTKQPIFKNFIKYNPLPPQQLTPLTRLNIYNYNILSPAKCGSRFLDKLFDTIDCSDGKQIISKDSKEGTDNIYQIKKAIPLQTLHSIDCEIDVNKIEWVILRPPEDLMISSIHTEMLMCWNQKNDKENIFTEDTIIDQLSKDGYNNHYSKNLYRDLCFLWMKSKKRIKFVHLKDLTLFSKDILRPYYRYDLDNWETKDYDFSNYDIWFSKDDVVTYYKNSYPILWEQLQSNLIKENIFWNCIIQGAEFYEPIVTKPVAKLI